MIAHGIGLDLFTWMVGSVAMTLIGGRLMRWGVFRLIRYPGRRRRDTSHDHGASAPARLLAAVRMGIGGVFLIAAVLLGAECMFLASCVFLPGGPVGGWVPVHLFTFLAMECAGGYDAVAEAMASDVLLIFCCLYAAVPLVREGLSTKRRKLPA